MGPFVPLPPVVSIVRFSWSPPLLLVSHVPGHHRSQTLSTAGRYFCTDSPGPPKHVDTAAVLRFDPLGLFKRALRGCFLRQCLKPPPILALGRASPPWPSQNPVVRALLSTPPRRPCCRILSFLAHIPLRLRTILSPTHGSLLWRRKSMWFGLVSALCNIPEEPPCFFPLLPKKLEEFPTVPVPLNATPCT